ncbi:MAG: hypothetical protein NTX73_02130 [Rhodobacterales bacterium]|nr:hypothetical protein [Rhodobacterales bacterium]
MATRSPAQVLNLASLDEGLVMLRWNKELPAASSQDPLGLNLRVSARLGAELLHCITSITPRARYFSFFPWAIQDYKDTEENKPGDRGFVEGVLAREKAMVLGAVFHHGGHACEGGALGGSDKAVAVANTEPQASYDLLSWSHLASPRGQLSAAYIASLVNLGLFEVAHDGVNEEVDPETNALRKDQENVDVTMLSERGKRLAQAFFRSIEQTDYATNHWSVKSIVDRGVLTNFGAAAGLCEIGTPSAEDRQVLREVFFSCDRSGTESGHHRRRMTLLLLLECARICERNATWLDEEKFADLVFYHGNASMLSRSVDPFDQALRDIAHRWRIFYFHGHFSLALQAALVAVVRSLRNKDGGIERSTIVAVHDGGTITRRVAELLGCNLKGDFFGISARETLKAIGVGVDDDLADPEKGISIGKIGGIRLEEQVARLLLDKNEANGPGGIGLATILLYVATLRYSNDVDARYDDWYPIGFFACYAAHHRADVEGHKPSRFHQYSDSRSSISRQP